MNLTNKLNVVCVNFMMDYHLLHALAVVAETRGFERAAKQLFLTQSAVSRRIQQLEQQLGGPVLIRSQPPQLTELGQRLLNHFQQVRQLEAVLGLDIGHVDGPLTVRLATNADSLATWLPEVLAVPPEDLAWPLKFDLVVEDQSVSLQRMRAGEVMVCICASAEPVHGGKVEPLGSLRYRAVVNPKLWQAAGKNIANVPALVFDQHDELQHQCLAELGLPSPAYWHRMPSSEGFLRSIKAGLGFGMLPELQLDDALSQGELVEIKPGYYLDTPLYWHYWLAESEPLRQLRQHAKAVASQRLVPIS